MSQNLDNAPEIPNEGQENSRPEENIGNSFVLDPQIPAADSSPFVSRFSSWIKIIAIIVLTAFIPDQISWAFGYNPTVLYKNMPSIYGPQDLEMTMPKPALQVAGSMEYLLNKSKTNLGFAWI